MKNIKTIMLLCISYFISRVIFYYMTSEILAAVYQGSQYFENFVYYTVFIGQTIVIFIAFNSLFKNHTNDCIIKLLWMIYFALMAVLLFGRQYIGENMNLSISGLLDFNRMNMLQIALNFILFLPLGYLLRKLPDSKAIIISILLVCLIELIQAVSHRGIFDLVDIIVDELGMITSFKFTKTIADNRSLQCK